MRHILLLIGLMTANAAVAQHKTLVTNSATDTDSVFNYVETMPEPAYDIHKYLNSHLQYPNDAYKLNLQGRVIVKFIVSEDGDITNCQVLKGIGSGCDEEALRLVKNMPRWKAGLHNATPVKVWCTMPVPFAIKKKEIVYNTAIDKLERLPKPDYDFDKYIREHLEYPRIAWEKKVQGTVTLLCLVEKDGSISDIISQKPLDFNCDKEAKELIGKMPNWMPGINKGEAVRAWTPISVPFVWSVDAKISAAKSYNEAPPTSGFDLPAYLSKNLHYPSYARDHNMQGRVIVKFVINEDGHVSDAVVLGGVGGGCDEEALRVVNNMPPWKPGMQQGKPVKVYFTLPIQFKIE